MTDNRNRLILIAVSIIALAIIIGGFVLGDGLRRARMAERAVTVRGLAERNVTANLATWTINFTAQGTDLGPVQAEIERDTETIRTFFRRAGFPDEAVIDGGGSVSQYYDSSRGQNQVTVRRSLQLRTEDIARARAIHARQFDLIRSGVAVEDGSGMQYSFTRLNDIKPEMIAEATRDARAAAEQFARDSGTGLGGIRTATQGYFSITARDGDPTDEGSSGRDSPFQKVRVVTTVEYYLD